jgi:L-fuculose-phosphate aldolase
MKKEKFNKYKKEVVTFMRRLYRQKLTTSLGGNISIRIKDNVFITPSQKDKATLSPEDIIVLNLYEELTNTELKPSMEYKFHIAIYKERNDINAIIHAHPFWGTWLAITHIKPNVYLTDEAFYTIRNVALCNYALMGSEELSNEIKKNIKTADILILKNHGIVSTGKDLCTAIERIEVLENIAHYTYLNTKKYTYKRIPKESIKHIISMQSNHENASS